MAPTSWTTTGSPGSTSSSLIERVRARDDEAWRRLVHIYGPLVGYWLRQAKLQPDDVRDVFQEVFRAIATGIGGFHKDRPSDRFRGWLRRIVQTKLADHFRRAGREPAGAGGTDAYQRLLEVEASAPGDESASDEAPALQQLRLRAVEAIRGEFEPRTWEAFWRVAVGGESPGHVAEDLGVTPAAVRMAKSRVLRRLRDELQDLET